MEGGAAASRRPKKEGSSPYRGVRIRGVNKYGAEITVPHHNKRKWLGTFPTEEEAAQAYDRAARDFGFAEWRCNFPRLPSADQKKAEELHSESSDQKKAEELPSESSGQVDDSGEQAPFQIDLNNPPPLV